MSKQAYGFEREFKGESVDTMVERITESLKAEGFGVLTEIDVKATLKKKIDVDFRPYRILGACNPKLAHRALSADPEIGLLLPCNVVVQESDGGAKVSILSPRAMFSLVDNDQMGELVEDAESRLKRALDSLA